MIAAFLIPLVIAAFVGALAFPAVRAAKRSGNWPEKHRR